jgi:hypothetical protein
VVTEDGAIRLYIGGSYGRSDGGQTIETERPETSEQFVGTLQMRGGQWCGSGLIFAQECAIDSGNRFCGRPAPAEFSAKASLVSGEAITATLKGEIQLVTSSGTETWSLDLAQWDFGPYPLPTGQLAETLAEFDSLNDVVVNLDSSGRLFFQSPVAGCVGNGTLAPHAAGPAGIYDVTLLMESCIDAFAYLNGTYGGLTLASPSSLWGYDSLLQIWLSKDPQNGPPAALTMLGEQM